jgi:hypothetical protein
MTSVEFGSGTIIVLLYSAAIIGIPVLFMLATNGITEGVKFTRKKLALLCVSIFLSIVFLLCMPGTEQIFKVLCKFFRYIWGE